MEQKPIIQNTRNYVNFRYPSSIGRKSSITPYYKKARRAQNSVSVPKTPNNAKFEFSKPQKTEKNGFMVSTQDAEFDHRPPNYTNLELQNRRTKTKIIINNYLLYKN